MQGCVYAFGDPRDGAIRYVGFTTNLKSRMSYHRGIAKRGHPSRVYQWFREVELPVLVVLEHDCPPERELYWIGRFSGLLNRNFNGRITY